MMLSKRDAKSTYSLVDTVTGATVESGFTSKAKAFKRLGELFDHGIKTIRVQQH
jgi:hypothetical protein